MAEIAAIEIPKEQPNFVVTPYVKSIVERALKYLQAGLPVHFSGPTGAGKTTLAMYVAGQLGRPVLLLHGDEELASHDLVGGQFGFRQATKVDNYIRSVLKAEEDVQMQWVDQVLTVACRHGYIFLYDEFTRTRPEANNLLLAVLEERILDLPSARGSERHLAVSPDFSALFTSNPEEYAGVHKVQDALLDRMITIRLDHYDRDTEIAITQAKSGIPRPQAEKIVDLVRAFADKKRKFVPTIRAAIMIARILSADGGRAAGKESFLQTCVDVLSSPREAPEKEAIWKKLEELIPKYC